MKKLFVSFFALIAVFSLQLIFSGTVANAEENTTEVAEENTPEIIDGRFLSKSELDSIRENGDYILELTYEQALERTAEVSGKSIEELRKENPSDTKMRAHPTGCGWMETSTTLTVKSYKPQLIVVVEACRNGSAKWVTNKQPLLQEFKADTKKFEGSIKVDLNSTGYEYIVNGVFYNSGTITHTGTTGANAVWTATYSVSTSDSRYGEIYTGLKSKTVVN